MNYESFRAAWNHAFSESRLSTIGIHATETLWTHGPDREHKAYVESLRGQDVDPFHVMATLWQRWDSLLTARAATTEEDVLRETMPGVDLEKLQRRSHVCESTSD